MKIIILLLVTYKIKIVNALVSPSMFFFWQRKTKSKNKSKFEVRQRIWQNLTTYLIVERFKQFLFHFCLFLFNIWPFCGFYFWITKFISSSLLQKYRIPIRFIILNTNEEAINKYSNSNNKMFMQKTKELELRRKSSDSLHSVSFKSSITMCVWSKVEILIYE